MCHSEDEKAAALAALKANGGKLRKTARETGIPVATLSGWRDADRSGVRTEKKEAAEQALADLYESLAREACGLLPSAMKRAEAKELGTIVGILTDKMQLLRGQPNSITKDVSTYTPEQRRKRIDELLNGRRGDRAHGSAGSGGERPTVQ